MTLDLREVRVANPWNPDEEPASLSFLLSRLLALAPEASFSNPAEASSASITLLREGVVELSPRLALHVEALIERTALLSNLAKAALLEEWFKQKLEQTHGK